MEAKLSAGIVRLKAADLNIPERDCCGEAVEGGFIPLIFEENARNETKLPVMRSAGIAVASDRYSAVEASLSSARSSRSGI
jgi:hypothetical protein